MRSGGNGGMRRAWRRLQAWCCRGMKLERPEAARASGRWTPSGARAWAVRAGGGHGELSRECGCAGLKVAMRAVVPPRVWPQRAAEASPRSRCGGGSGPLCRLWVDRKGKESRAGESGFTDRIEIGQRYACSRRPPLRPPDVFCTAHDASCDTACLHDSACLCEDDLACIPQGWR
jgi:hypothetical protein